jgi:hypothetical protein
VFRRESSLNTGGRDEHPPMRWISAVSRGNIQNLPKLTPICPKLTHQIAKKGDLSIMFFEILDYMLFQAKPVKYWALKSALTDPFEQTISSPIELE